MSDDHPAAPGTVPTVNDQNFVSNPALDQSEIDLADAVRRLIATVHGHQNAGATNRDAISSIEDAIAGLDRGPVRSRWYEGPGDGRRHRDLSAFTGRLNPLAPPMRVRQGEDDGRPCLIGEVRIEREREGPPGCVHGGVIAGLFDELAGAAQNLVGRRGGVTGRLEVRFRKPTPLSTDLTFIAYVDDDRERRVVVRAHCLADGHVTAEAEALFLRVPWLAAGTPPGMS